MEDLVVIELMIRYSFFDICVFECEFYTYGVSWFGGFGFMRVVGVIWGVEMREEVGGLWCLCVYKN